MSDIFQIYKGILGEEWFDEMISRFYNGCDIHYNMTFAGAVNYINKMRE